MRRKTEKKIEARLSGCGKAAPWKSPQNGLSHLAWKSAKPADSHFSTATTATDGLLFEKQENRKTKPPTLSDINLLQQKNGLDYRVHRKFGIRRLSFEIIVAGLGAIFFCEAKHFSASEVARDRE